jgi:hypothetical protein
MMDEKMLIAFDQKPSTTAIQQFYDEVNKAGYQLLVQQLLAYKERQQLSDWLFYQLVRKTSQQLSAK